MMMPRRTNSHQTSDMFHITRDIGSGSANMANFRSARPRLQQHSLMKRKSPAESAFFNPRFLVGFVLCLIGVVLALLGFHLSSSGSASAQGPNQNPGSSGVEVGASYQNDVSPPMRDVPPWSASGLKPQHEANENPKVPYRHKDSADPVVQKTSISIRNMVAPNLPSPLLNFDGISFPGLRCNCAPPDTNGAVGTTQSAQIVNERYQVLAKATGN